MPARYLLRFCPSQFFAINAYLQTANRQKPPDYAFIADKLRESLEEVKAQPEELPLNTGASNSLRRKNK